MSDLEDQFNTFLAEVEALSIQHADPTAISQAANESPSNSNALTTNDICTQEQNQNHIAAGSTATARSEEDKKSRRKEKESVIKNATNNSRAWAEFTKLDLPKPVAGSTPDGDVIRPKISFKIQSGKSKSKKKNKSTRQAEKEMDSMISDFAAGIENTGTHDKQSSHTGGDVSHKESSTNSSCFSQDSWPSWTLVIDTSSLVNDNGFEVQRLIDLASHVSNKHFNWQKQNANSRQYASVNAIMEEPITIVMPYKVWNELEYQSKSDNSDLAFSARTVMRMLRDELQQSYNYTVKDNVGPSRVVRSQSILESQDAAKKYVSHDIISNPTNDDHIIACALLEQSKCAAEPGSSISGGVVMITSDNNMTCKALSNGLKVYSPSKFHAYYQERIESLRQRASRR